MYYDALLKAILVIILLLLPGLTGRILSSVIGIYYRNHRYNTKSYALTAKEMLETYIRDTDMSTQVRLRKGMLTDAYNPDTDYIYLSESVYNSRLLLSVSVAFHELSHMILFREGERSHRVSVIIEPSSGFCAKVMIIMACLIFIFRWNHPVFVVIFSVSAALYTAAMISVLMRERLASARAAEEMRGMGASSEDISKASVLLRMCWLTYLFRFISNLAIVFLLTVSGKLEKT